jgi:predicted enzyme related to lactoylglutathione lyase
VDWKLELVVLPVSDIDRAKAFYAEKAGFNLDVDHDAGNFRVVQLTPSGSACSISFGTFSQGKSGSIEGLHLIVSDIEAARAELVSRGVDATEIYHFGETGQVPGPHPDRGDYESFFNFSDPDGNTFAVQEVKYLNADT